MDLLKTGLIEGPRTHWNNVHQDPNGTQQGQTTRSLFSELIKWHLCSNFWPAVQNQLWRTGARLVEGYQDVLGMEDLPCSENLGLFLLEISWTWRGFRAAAQCLWLGCRESQAVRSQQCMAGIQEITGIGLTKESQAGYKSKQASSLRQS